MSWFNDLLFSTSVAHSILLIALTIAAGILLSRIKIMGISLGIAWILFVGIFFSHFGLVLDHDIEHFAKELGLILFVYSIGLQVGPGFFSSLRKGGLSLNLLAISIVLLGCITTYIIHLVTGEDLSTMVGILSGAVTNTPGLGAAQQTFLDSTSQPSGTIALGYAVAYPLGVIGIITSMIILKNIFRNKLSSNDIDNIVEKDDEVICLDIKITNKGVVGKTLKDTMKLLNIEFVVSRIFHNGATDATPLGETVLAEGDILRVVTKEQFVESVITFLGEKAVIAESKDDKSNLISRRIVITKENINGKKIGDINVRALYKVNITRVNRAGVDLIASNDLILQIADRVTVVGEKDNIIKVADLLGNSMKKLDHPNLFPIFFGIFLGVLVGSIPFMIPGIPQPIKLGLAGGPLIVAILISRFGPYYKLVTFTTTSANMMLREIGISLFLATVGLGAGAKFVDTIVNGGYWWVLYGVIITLVPLILVGIFAIFFMKLNVGTLMGLLAGSTTDPPALAFANSSLPNDKASIAYATVYPLTMFLRVLTAQILILISLS